MHLEEEEWLLKYYVYQTCTQQKVAALQFHSNIAF